MTDDGEHTFAIDTSDCPGDEVSAPIEDTITIGASLPLSGGPAALFAPYGAGLAAYVDFYNETEGGVDGRTLEFVQKDDQYSADLTDAAISELIFDEEVDVISAVIGTPNNLAIRDLLNEECVPHMYASSGAPDFGDVSTHPWTSGVLVPYVIESELWAETVADLHGEGASVAIYHVDNEFGVAYVDAFEAAAEELGLEIVATETISAGDNAAPSGQMTNIVASEPDAILAIPLGAQCIAFMAELGNAKAANDGFDPDVYQTATCASPVFFGPAGEAADGVLTSSNLKDVNDPELADDADVAQYLEAFASTGSDADPGGIAVAGWVAMETTVATLEAAAASGELTRESIVNAMRNLDFQPSLLLDGLSYQMDSTDGYVAEGTRLTRWNAADQVFVPEGEAIDFEDSAGIG